MRPVPKRLNPARSPSVLVASSVTSVPVLQPASDTRPKRNDAGQVTLYAGFEWNYVVSCEARNALQVVLSGGEILLDQEYSALTLAQRDVLVKMIESARHLHRLMATLRDTEDPSLSGK